MNNSFKILLSEFALKNLKSFDKFASKRIIKKLNFFETSIAPLAFSKKLKGHENLFRFRIGEYRAIFTINNQKEISILYILKIAHRKDAYE